jgi:hypothetical protein
MSPQLALSCPGPTEPHVRSWQKLTPNYFQFSSTPSCRLLQEPIESLRLGVGPPLLHSGRARVVARYFRRREPPGVGGSRLSTRSVMTTKRASGRHLSSTPYRNGLGPPALPRQLLYLIASF